MEPLPSIPRHRARKPPARQILAKPPAFGKPGPKAGGNSVPPRPAAHKPAVQRSSQHTLLAAATYFARTTHCAPGHGSLLCKPVPSLRPQHGKASRGATASLPRCAPCCAKGFARPHTLTAAVRFCASHALYARARQLAAQAPRASAPKHGKATWHYSAAYAVSPAVQKALPALTSCSRHTLCASHALHARARQFAAQAHPRPAAPTRQSHPRRYSALPRCTHCCAKGFARSYILQPPYTLRVPRAARQARSLLHRPAPGQRPQYGKPSPGPVEPPYAVPLAVQKALPAHTLLQPPYTLCVPHTGCPGTPICCTSLPKPAAPGAAKPAAAPQRPSYAMPLSAQARPKPAPPPRQPSPATTEPLPRRAVCYAASFTPRAPHPPALGQLLAALARPGLPGAGAWFASRCKTSPLPPPSSAARLCSAGAAGGQAPVLHGLHRLLYAAPQGHPAAQCLQQLALPMANFSHGALYLVVVRVRAVAPPPMHSVAPSATSRQWAISPRRRSHSCVSTW